MGDDGGWANSRFGAHLDCRECDAPWSCCLSRAAIHRKQRFRRILPDTIMFKFLRPFRHVFYRILEWKLGGRTQSIPVLVALLATDR